MTDHPPPGDRREQLPDHLLDLIRDRLPNYVSTACQTADTLACTATYRHPRYDEIRAHAERLHNRCRTNQKFTGQPCACGCHPHDVCPYREDCPLIPRALMDEHVATVHPEVKTGAPETAVAGAEQPVRTTVNNPAATAQATLTITVTAPNPVHAVRWAGHVRNHIHAEFDGSMRLDSFIELEPANATVHRVPCPHCESSSDRIPRADMGQHIADTHPEVQAGA